MTKTLGGVDRLSWIQRYGGHVKALCHSHRQRDRVDARVLGEWVRWFCLPVRGEGHTRPA